MSILSNAGIPGLGHQHDTLATCGIVELELFSSSLQRSVLINGILEGQSFVQRARSIWVIRNGCNIADLKPLVCTLHARKRCIARGPPTKVEESRLIILKR